MELHYYDIDELTILIDFLIKRINNIIIKFDTNDFQDKAIKDALVLDIQSLDADPNWRSSDKYEGVSPPSSKIRKIILTKYYISHNTRMSLLVVKIKRIITRLTYFISTVTTKKTSCPY